MTAALAREAFGAEFLGADGFLNSPTYGLPPQFMVQALQGCIARWQAGTMEVPSFDEDVRAGRAGYAALTGVPANSVVSVNHTPGAAWTEYALTNTIVGQYFLLKLEQTTLSGNPGGREFRFGAPLGQAPTRSRSHLCLPARRTGTWCW